MGPDNPVNDDRGTRLYDPRSLSSYHDSCEAVSKSNDAADIAKVDDAAHGRREHAKNEACVRMRNGSKLSPRALRQGRQRRGEKMATRSNRATNTPAVRDMDAARSRARVSAAARATGTVPRAACGERGWHTDAGDSGYGTRNAHGAGKLTNILRYKRVGRQRQEERDVCCQYRSEKRCEAGSAPAYGASRPRW